jgi:hypothetical protein
MATSSAFTSVDSEPGKRVDATGAQTCCATCRTVFEVAPELLSSTDTRVRCGECYAIFDAAANLVGGASGTETAAEGGTSGDSASADGAAASDTGRQSSESAHTDSSGENAQLDVTYSDFDLFSEDADLPEIAYFDQTRDTPEFDFDSVALENDETFSETLFSRDLTVDASTLSSRSASSITDTALLADDVPHEPLVFNYRDPEPDTDTAGTQAAEAARAGHTAIPIRMDEGEPPETPPVSFADAPAEQVTEIDALVIDSSEPKAQHSFGLLFVLTLCLALLLSGLYGWRHRDSLHNQSLTRPVYDVYCRVTGCEVPTRVSLNELRLVRRNVYSHPEIDDALAVDVTFSNQAEFDQRYPVLSVRFSDSNGRLVASHAFVPADYLAGWQPSDTVAAGAQRDISLDVSDPGDNASSFEVEFQEAAWAGGN